ncbi:hypothetical protein B9Z65_5955 [Elsinoe australis]|uniref:Calcineurin-like phosphoesterase domain-containing protein n=1 Tax=Elsinoe australis TaxID=40998 RepID=A0A2P7YJM3_9PEZI|nr:hypothetical protein B9Z65_5955 [Elsinoe australis]
MADSIRTSVLIISDTHLASPFPNGVPSDLPHIDVLVHAGDLTMVGTVPEYHQVLDMLATIPADVKLVIPGNHDLALDGEWLSRKPERLQEWKLRNGVRELDLELGERQLREAESVWFGEQSRAVKEGVTMLREGTHEIKLKNGAMLKIYASPYQPEFCDWAFAYQKNEDRFNAPEHSLSDATNIATHPVDPAPGATHGRSNTISEIDIMVTHGPPYGRLDFTTHGMKVGCPHLLAAVSRVRPKIHAFGHIHEGWGVERITWDKMGTAALSAPANKTKSFMEAWNAAEYDLNIEKLVPDKDPSNRAPGPIIVDLSNLSAQPAHHEKQTALINAAIMDVSYMPINNPILAFINLAAA